ncbi:hypothetical protein [Pseudomonas fragariae (ex Marin et al. 2024)]|uniref:hypothetical protein n=1 Tax=Pseudomonas fragariae (ex Marin et al. 2024) TaxID=3080056 RepID=UPI002A244949|nr:hypothetical protein [Pseudomonas sp. 20]MDX9625936.1 hypothetical protein [Pseudomonas sp. 20]
MVDQPYFPELIIDGQSIDLAHLEPFTFVIHSEKAKRDLRVHVTFSTHCFSISYLQENHPAGQPVIDAASARPRTFCPIRYRLSHQLPALIQSLNHPKAKVWETATERNWCYSITIDDPKGPYHVFFEVRRATSERRQWQDLNLVVESAYHEADGGGPRLKGSMAFPLLCGKIYLRERTATKR